MNLWNVGWYIGEMNEGVFVYTFMNFGWYISEVGENVFVYKFVEFLVVYTDGRGVGFYIKNCGILGGI